MENIKTLIDKGDMKKVAEALPPPAQMKNFTLVNVPANKTFYSVRQPGGCEFKKKQPFKDGTKRHKLFFFCDDLELCIYATKNTGSGGGGPVWIASNSTELKIVKIDGWRHQFLNPYYDGYLDIDYYDKEIILYYYLIKHELDGFQAATMQDQPDFKKKTFEFAFLEKVMQKKVMISSCVPLASLNKSKIKF